MQLTRPIIHDFRCLSMLFDYANEEHVVQSACPFLFLCIQLDTHLAKVSLQLS